MFKLGDRLAKRFKFRGEFELFACNRDMSICLLRSTRAKGVVMYLPIANGWRVTWWLPRHTSPANKRDNVTPWAGE